MIKRLFIGLIVTVIIFVMFIGSVYAFSFNQDQPENPEAAFALASVKTPRFDNSDTALGADTTDSVAKPYQSQEISFEPAAETSRAESSPKYVVIITEVGLYAGPDSTYGIVGRMGAGDAAKVTACNRGCTWYLIEAGHWIPGNALASQPTDLPVSDYAPALGDSTNQSSGPVVLALPTVTPTPAPTPTPVWTGPIASDYAILRRGPGTTFEQVSMVLPGNPLPIVAKNVAGDWYQLENGAWVAAFLADRKLEELPVSDNIPSPPAGALDLEVSFTNPHYKCMQSAYSFENIAGEVLQPWVYRSFQVGMSIRNLNTAPVLPIYKPSRWIVTDGVYEFVETVSWQATGSGPAEDRQRILYYDDAASMTWYMVSLERDQWVRAIEFEWNGQLYRTEFDPAQAQEVQNYKDCGESRASID